MLGQAALCLALALAGDAPAPSYFPLQVGNWWAYEEQDEDGKALSRETWTLVPGDQGERAGEFHLRSSAKRLDALGRVGRHWEGHEYLRVADDGLRKRYPSGREAESEVLVVKQPAVAGTRWHDTQGDCEVTSASGGCSGPRGALGGCLTIVCRLGRPTATVVTSTYAPGIGMVRQEVDVIQLVPRLEAPPGLPLPTDAAKGGHSVLRLTAYHVAP